MIWPAVVLSARSIARRLLGPKAGARQLALVTGLLVAFDASIIEPLAVAEGLWSWNAPGSSRFRQSASSGGDSSPLRRAGSSRATACARGRGGRHRSARRARHAPGRLVGRAPLAAARTNRPGGGHSDDCRGLAVYLVAVRLRRAGLPRHETISRLAATCFYAVILARHADAWLWGYAVAFAPPHLLLSFQGWSRGRSRRE